MNKPKIKIKPYLNQVNNPVTLSRYSMVEDKDTDEKFLVLKLYNNENMLLYNFEIEIVEINEDGDSIVKSTYNINDLAIQPKEYFIPLYKIKVDNQTQSIQFKTLKATYKNKKWDGSDWIIDEEEKPKIKKEPSPTQYSMYKVRNKFKLIYISILLSLIAIIILIINISDYYQIDLFAGSILKPFEITNNIKLEDKDYETFLNSDLMSENNEQIYIVLENKVRIK